MAVGLLRRLLAHPLTAGIDLDDPAVTELRKQVISTKPLLKAIYDEWYAMLAAGLPAGSGPVLELGSGAGYCDRFIPGLITSELLYCPSVQLGLDAQHMPFADGSLRAIVFTGVLHHIPNVRLFFAEAERSVHPGGRILMVEPWVTAWSRFAYKNLHHEPFSPEATDWSFPSSGPLSGANIAIPWIVFERDRGIFESEFPGLKSSRSDLSCRFVTLSPEGLAFAISCPHSHTPFGYSWNAFSIHGCQISECMPTSRFGGDSYS